MYSGVITPRSRISYPEKLTTHDLLSFRSIAISMLSASSGWSERLPWLCLPSLKNNSLALGLRKPRPEISFTDVFRLATNTMAARGETALLRYLDQS